MSSSVIKGTAILLCIVFPGAGQIYLGQYKKGIILYVLAFLLISYPLVWIISLIDIVFNKQGVYTHTANPFSEKRNVLIVSILTAPVSLVFVMLLSFQIYSVLNNNVLAEGRTEKEMTEIVESLDAYRDFYGNYPESVEELVSIKPLREGWKKDHWNVPYYYTSNDSGFVLISVGKDRTLFTEDDLKRNGKAID